MVNMNISLSFHHITHTRQFIWSCSGPHTRQFIWSCSGPRLIPPVCVISHFNMNSIKAILFIFVHICSYLAILLLRVGTYRPYLWADIIGLLFLTQRLTSSARDNAMCHLDTMTSGFCHLVRRTSDAPWS